MALGNLRSRAIENSPLKSAEFRAVIGVSLLIMFGFGLIVPTLPLFAKRFGVGEAGVGLLLTVFAATRLAADFVAGNLIDRYGERVMAALGAGIVGLSSILAGAAPNYPALVVLRGLGGVGSAFFLGALMAHLIGMVSAEERGRAMSVFQAVLGIGFLLGPVFGGVLAAATDLRTPLFVYGGICLACAPLVLRVMSRVSVPPDALAGAPEIEAVSVPAPSVRAWTRLRPLLSDSAYRAALVGSAAGFYVTGGLQTLIPGFWVDVLARDDGGVGLPFTVLSLASLIVIWHAGSISDRLGRKVTMVPSLAATAVICALLGTVRSAVVLIVLLALLGFANGYSRPGPTSIVGDVAPPDARGVAVAGYRTAGDVGALIGPIVVGLVAEHFGYGPAFVAIGVVGALAFVAAVLARETAPNRRAAAPARA
jgi:MFS transporter, DHA1 family, multidrug resistance protein